MNVSGWRSMHISLFAALLATSALGGATGCEPQGEPSIEGATPQEAAVITAEVSCAYLTRCGIPQVTCSDSTAPGDDGDCETAFEPIEMGECLEQAEPLLAEGFGCAELDAGLRARVDECLAAFETSVCAEVSDAASTAFGMPKVCAEALEAILACTEGGETTGEPSADPPGEPLPSNE